ncbi:MAG: phenylalanine--tRNA ligase subunit beta [Ferruginibacter sp.]
MYTQKTIFAGNIYQYMTISYNWLSDYLPTGSENPDPQILSQIMTAIGLEVETMDTKQEITGGLQGLLVGEVITCEKHPEADKLKLTTVSTNNGKLLNIVCGAPNVAAGQKVIVAPIGTMIYPINGVPVTIKKAKIRGIESEGMLCAADEIGLSADHAGIIVLPGETATGTPVSQLFKSKEDTIYEIGLTPNRIDAMSHIGVAKDVCAYLSHHNKKEILPVLPYINNFKADDQTMEMEVVVQNETACKRYSGISISGISIAQSPGWLKEKLQSVGVKSINNIVDITNFILHETGQPLHAFDADKIEGKKIIVRTAADGELFTTLDDKERKLLKDDLLIADISSGMCIAGVYGGIQSGVTNDTKNIFLESAWFDPIFIRKTSLKHGLRTDAAARFEKGTDISNTVTVLKRAALLIREIAGGKISSDIIDIYPSPLQKTRVGLKNNYLKKLSGKNYHSDTTRNILKSLGFEIVKEGVDETWVDVPFSKPDISLPADIVEEIMRIDGLDNIDIPDAITISPSVEKDIEKFQRKEKLSNYLVGLGFFEIFTNSITNSSFFEKEELHTAVKMINNLSSELNIMRPEMLQGGLQVITHNNNRKNYDLLFFEFGKTYNLIHGDYNEPTHLTLYATGNSSTQDWKTKPLKSDFYYLKGVIENLLSITGIREYSFETNTRIAISNCTEIKSENRSIGYIGEVNDQTLKKFDIKYPVFYADLFWDEILLIAKEKKIRYFEIPKFPAVIRDLSLVVDKKITYEMIKRTGMSANIPQLRSIELFDIFESDKLGNEKKAIAVSFIFLDIGKTLTDIEVDGFMQKIIVGYQTNLNAQIRK